MNRLQPLTNYLSADIFEFIEDCKSFHNAAQILENLFVRNFLFCKQIPYDDYTILLRCINILLKACTFLYFVKLRLFELNLLHLLV